MNESWDDYAVGWDCNESVIAYSKQAYRALLNTVDIDGYRVLDFGCGTGLLTEKLASHASSVVALDPSEKMINVLNSKRLKNVSTLATELTQALINDNELLSPKFDLIVASSALAFVPDYQDALNLLKQLLKEGGYFVQWDWLREDDILGIGFTEEEISVALHRTGFSECSLSIPFSMDSAGSTMKVIMGVAKNT